VSERKLLAYNYVALRIDEIEEADTTTFGALHITTGNINFIGIGKIINSAIAMDFGEPIIFNQSGACLVGLNLTGPLTMHAHRIVLLEDPVDAQDAATKNYVDHATGIGTRHLTLDFTFSDISSSPLYLGSIPAGVFVGATVIIIKILFNQNITIEIGRTGSPADLMLGIDNNPLKIDEYTVQPNKSYAVDTPLYLTLLCPSTMPTTGSGQVLVYFN
jgi:hypothetical protein